jgi:hypothetical protein
MTARKFHSILLLAFSASWRFTRWFGPVIPTPVLPEIYPASASPIPNTISIWPGP